MDVRALEAEQLVAGLRVAAQRPRMHSGPSFDTTGFTCKTWDFPDRPARTRTKGLFLISDFGDLGTLVSGSVQLRSSPVAANPEVYRRRSMSLEHRERSRRISGTVLVHPSA